MRNKIKEMEVVVLLDANEEWTGKSKVKEMAIEIGLYNVGRRIHDNTLPPTFPQSVKTLDYILVSEGVVGNIEAMGAAPFVKDSLGDHRGLFIDLNIDTLLNIGPIDAEMGATRRLQYQNVKIVDKYLEILETKLKEHRVFDRLEKIFQEAKETKTMSIRNIKEYETVDRDVYRLAKHAKNKCCIML